MIYLFKYQEKTVNSPRQGWRGGTKNLGQKTWGKKLCFNGMFLPTFL
jgi:hypothetical protein